ncbi:MAG: WD40 repeat domain-containing protein [Chloroflexota bacterium]
MTAPQVITPTTVEAITPTRLFGPHDTFLTAIAFSPDGRLMATADVQGYVKLWDVESGALVAGRRVFTVAVQSLAFNPTVDEVHIAVAAQLERVVTVTVSDSKSLKVLTEMTQENHRLLDVTFSPDGRPIVACVNATEADPKLYLLYADADKSLLAAFRSGNDNNPNARFDNNGALIAVGHDSGSVSIRGARKDGAARQRIDTGFFGVLETNFSGDNRRIAVLEDQGDRVGVYAVANGERISELNAGDLINDVYLNVDGSLLIVTSKYKGGSMYVYNVMTGALHRTLKGSSPIAFDPAGGRIAAGNNYAVYSKSVMLWDEFDSPGGILSQSIAPVDVIAAEAQGVSQLAVLHGHQKKVTALAFSPDNNTLATVGADSTVRLWSMETGGESAVFHDHHAEITGVAYSPDGRTLATCSGYFNNSDDNTVRLYDTDENQLRLEFEGHKSRVVGVEYDPRGDRIISAESNGVILVWNPADGRILQRIETPTEVNDFTVSPEGGLVATAHGSETALKDTVARVWNIVTGELLREFADLADWLLQIRFSPDGNVLLVADYSGRVAGWDVDTGDIVRDFTGGFDVRYNPQGNLVAVAQDKTVKLIRVTGGDTLMTLRHGSNVHGIGFSDEGDLFAVGTSEGEVVVWGVKDTSTEHANTEQIERERIKQARSGRHTLQLLAIECKQAQERDGDETFIRLDGQTIWSIERAGRKMHHNPTRPKEVSTFDFQTCKMLGKDGWQETDNFRPSDFRLQGLTGPVSLEVWEEDNFLRGGNDYLGTIRISPAKAGQGPQEAVIYTDGANYVVTYEITFD